MRSLLGSARIPAESHIYEKFLTWSRGWALRFLGRDMMALVL